MRRILALVVPLTRWRRHQLTELTMSCIRCMFFPQAQKLTLGALILLAGRLGRLLPVPHFLFKRTNSPLVCLAFRQLL